MRIEIIKGDQWSEINSHTTDLHEALLDKSGNEFWISWRSKFGTERAARTIPFTLLYIWVNRRLRNGVKMCRSLC